MPILKLARRLAARIDALHFRLFRAERHGRVVIERIDGADILVLPSVLNPFLFRTGPLLARAVANEIHSGARVLDMGSGSGIVSVLAARAGAEVWAVDANPEAVRATKASAAMNGFHVDARRGDLFAPLGEERFDLIAFNPPFFERPSPGSSGIELALYDGPGLPTLSRFLDEAHAHLTERGAILIAGSTNGALGAMRALYVRHGYEWTTVRSRERLAERLVVDRLDEARA